MTEALHVVLSLIVGLFGFLVSAVAAVEEGVRSLLARMGVTGELQSAVLAIVALLLVVAAFRLFGRVFALLILLFLLLLLLHVVAPDLAVQLRHGLQT